MNNYIDETYLFQTLERLVNTPSPVGFYELGNEFLTSEARSLGLTACTDNRHTLYLSLGHDNPELNKKPQNTVLIGAHMDTLGYLVKYINADGTIALKSLGGTNNHSLEHEKAYLFTRQLTKFTGYIVLKHHSVHVYDDAREMPRDDENMLFLLDEEVSSSADVRSLGIEVGDVIAPEPHFEMMPNGRIRSRFLDNKAAAAVSLAVIECMVRLGLQPKRPTLFAFPYYEEVNAGGSYVPASVAEYLAIDIGVIGPENRGSEKSVSIIAADRLLNYDRELTGRLIQTAKDNGINHTVEVFRRYSTDAMCAFMHGNNLQHAAFGMTVMTSHGVERTWGQSILETAKLCLAYVADLD